MAITKGKITGRTYFSEKEIEDMILKSYPEPSYTVLFQLRDGTGYATRGREADAIVFGTWPSRGFQIIGFEIKSSRSDWKNELANPEKAESIGRFCDHWTVIGAEDVIKLEEVPPAWGWEVPTEKGLMTKKDPNPVIEPIPISKVFLMSIVRNLAKSHVRKTVIDEMVVAKLDEAIKNRDDKHKYELERLRKRDKELKDFEQSSGIEITGSWDVENGKVVGEIVKAVLNNSLAYNIEQIKRGAEACHDLLTKIAALPFFTERLGK